MSKRHQQKRERKNLLRKRLRQLVMLNGGWSRQLLSVTRLEKRLKTAHGAEKTVINRLLKGQIGKANFDPTAGRGFTHERMKARGEPLKGRKN